MSSADIFNEIAFEERQLYREQLRLTERYRKECVEYSHDTIGVLKMTSANNQRSLPYDDYTGLMELHRLAYGIQRWSDPAAHVVGALIGSAIGDGEKEQVKYTVVKVEDPCGSDTSVDDSFIKKLQCTINEVMLDHHWHRMQERLIERFYFPGEVIRRLIQRDEETDIQYLETSQLQPPKNEAYVRKLKQAAKSKGLEDTFDRCQKLGIIHDTIQKDYIDKTKPDFYLIGPESDGTSEEKFLEPVEAKWIQHLKNGVDETDPRGYSPFVMVYCNVYGAINTRHYAREMVYARCSHSVIEHVGTVKRRALQNLLGAEAAAASKDDRTEPNDNGPYPAGAKRFTTSESVEMPNLNLSASDIQTMVELDEKPIGRVINAPDYITLCKSDIGNRNTTESSASAWYTRIRRTQRMVRESDVDMFWKIIQIKHNLTEEMLSKLKKAVAIKADFPDPERNLIEDHQRNRELYDRACISRRTLNEVNGHDDEIEQQQIKKEQSEMDDSALSVRFGPNGAPRQEQVGSNQVPGATQGGTGTGNADPNRQTLRTPQRGN